LKETVPDHIIAYTESVNPICHADLVYPDTLIYAEVNCILWKWIIMQGYRKNPLFVMRKIGDQGFLVPVSEDIQKMRRAYKLNNLGLFAWKNFDRHRDPKTLASLISKKYSVDEAIAFRDLMAFLEELLRVGALVRKENR
jgi:hypothetical protein